MPERELHCVAVTDDGHGFGREGVMSANVSSDVPSNPSCMIGGIEYGTHSVGADWLNQGVVCLT